MLSLEICAEEPQKVWNRLKSVQRKRHKHICRRLRCLHFNSSNSNKQYNSLLVVLLLFKQTMTSGTRDPTKYIRRGKEGVRVSDVGVSENQATVRSYHVQKIINNLNPYPDRAFLRSSRLGDGGGGASAGPRRTYSTSEMVSLEVRIMS